MGYLLSKMIYPDNETFWAFNAEQACYLLEDWNRSMTMTLLRQIVDVWNSIFPTYLVEAQVRLDQQQIHIVAKFLKEHGQSRMHQEAVQVIHSGLTPVKCETLKIHHRSLSPLYREKGDALREVFLKALVSGEQIEIVKPTHVWCFTDYDS